MAPFGITATIFLLAFAGLAVGVILTEKKELQGSCGGPNVNPECCQTCPEKDACDDVADLELEVPPVPERQAPAGLSQHPSA